VPVFFTLFGAELGEAYLFEINWLTKALGMFEKAAALSPTIWNTGGGLGISTSTIQKWRKLLPNSNS
jgi:hypothetical protein